MKKFDFIIYCLLGLTVICLLEKKRTASAEKSMIIINYDKSIGSLNKKILGNNFIGYDPVTYENSTKERYDYSDFGAGIWDATKYETVKEVIKLAKEAGISILRFPGGCGIHHYNWKKAIDNEREHFLYGIDEFLMTCKEIETEAVITVSYFTGNEQDAADLVEYLNSPNDGKHIWAKKRAINGHEEPYNIKYFEIGNEVWHGNHRGIKQVSPEEYAQRYIKYYEAMKSVDRAIQIGLVLYMPEWNKAVMEKVKDKVDFGITHIYPAPREKLEELTPNDIFKITLAEPILWDEQNIQDTLKLLKKHTGQDILLAITEYNGGFAQDKPIPYRHCLGTALLNAELLRIFMKPENNILMANYWQFCNSYWGMIVNGFDGEYNKLFNPYYKRPNYYVYELYNRHFGNILLNVSVKSDYYEVNEYQSIEAFIRRSRRGNVVKGNLLKGVWEINKSPGIEAKEKDGILAIDFQHPTEYNYYHSKKRIQISPASFYKLSGYIKAENLIDEVGVCLTIQDGRGWTKTHSSASTDKIIGTTDWIYEEIIYKTLPDAREIDVIARRVGEKGALSGKAYFKDVQLEKFIPSIDTKIPYLSVNASKSSDGKSIFFMVVNRHMEANISATICLKGFTPSETAKAWVLNGPSIDAINENDHENVKVTDISFEVKGNIFSFSFEPHSLTALEIQN
ncbi:MAG: alpha-L-arabinofuranosidase C-terminal domain-containing protein [bacterium]